MRDLTALEIDELDFSGRIPEMDACEYQLIGLVSETPLRRKQSRKTAPLTQRETRKNRWARSA